MRRHDLVTLRPWAGWRSACTPAGSRLWWAAEQWIVRGLPLVAARQVAEGAQVSLGLSLPLRHDRQRLAIAVAPTAIAEVRPPLSITACLPQLPAEYAAPLRELERRAAACSVRLGVFGSLAWESLSGEAYRHAASDIDLICDVASSEQLAVVLAALQEAAAGLPCRLDGEIRFPDGNAVAWREVAECLKVPTATVLAKGPHIVHLMPLQQLLDCLEEPCHA